MKTAKEQMRDLFLQVLKDSGLSQAEFSRRSGISAKHINQVIKGHADTTMIDYWVWVLGYQFKIELVQREGDENGQ